MGAGSLALLVARPLLPSTASARRIWVVATILLLVLTLMLPVMSGGAQTKPISTLGRTQPVQPIAAVARGLASPAPESVVTSTNQFSGPISSKSGAREEVHLERESQPPPPPAGFRPPGLVVSPGDGEVNSHVTVGGSFFDPFANYTVFWSDSEQVCAGFTNALGNFTCGFNVPPAVAGKHSVSAYEGNNSAGTTFAVQPSLMLSTGRGAVGSYIVAAGAGYHGSNASANVIYGIWWSQTLLLCTGKTTPTGNLSCAFKVPSVSVGSYPITVNDSTDPLVTVFFTIPGPSHGLPIWVIWSVVATIGAGVVVAILLVAQFLQRHWRGANPARRAPFESSPRRHGWSRAFRRRAGESTVDLSPEALLGSDANRPLPREGFSDPERPGVIYVRIRKRRSDLYPGEPIVADPDSETPPADPPN
jgi:hypothetical protein